MSMNYITEINCFYDWLETNKISDSAISLWHALMHINNKSGWKRDFAVAISTIENKTGLSKSSILRSRNTLQQAGRIKFISREGQKSAIYSIVAFHSDAQGGTQTVTQPDTQTVTQTVTDLKLNKTKQNNSLPNPRKQPKKIDLEGKHFVGGFKPTDTEMELPEMEIGKTVQYLRLSTKKILTESDVGENWKAFKLQHFTGEKYYENNASIYQHFRDWLKFQKHDTHQGHNSENNNGHSRRNGGFQLVTGQLKEQLGQAAAGGTEGFGVEI